MAAHLLGRFGVMREQRTAREHRQPAVSVWDNLIARMRAIGE